MYIYINFKEKNIDLISIFKSQIYADGSAIGPHVASIVWRLLGEVNCVVTSPIKQGTDWVQPWDF